MTDDDVIDAELLEDHSALAHRGETALAPRTRIAEADVPDPAKLSSTALKVLYGLALDDQEAGSTRGAAAKVLLDACEKLPEAAADPHAYAAFLAAVERERQISALRGFLLGAHAANTPSAARRIRSAHSALERLVERHEAEGVAVEVRADVLPSRGCTRWRKNNSREMTEDAQLYPRDVTARRDTDQKSGVDRDARVAAWKARRARNDAGSWVGQDSLLMRQRRRAEEQE